MGLLSKGTPLSWEQSRAYHDYVKRHGILQFLNIYHAMAGRENDIFLWGDEVEHMIVRIDPHSNTATLALRAPEILAQLEALSQQQQSDGERQWNAHFVPEYGRYMVEATPARPYGGYTADLRMVEPNMRLRRQMVQQLLQPYEYIMTLTAFPLLGVGRYSTPAAAPYGPIARSLYIADEVIGPHPRFATLTRNIRIRRGSKVCIRVPLFQDKRTREVMQQQLRLRDKPAADRATEMKEQSHQPHSSSSSLPSPSPPSQSGSTQYLPFSPRSHAPPTTSSTNVSSSGEELYPPIPDFSCVPPIDELNEIHMDAMAFGMGQSCLQVTFQTRSIREARHLYDHLAVLSPIMLALSAATPFHRGRIADIDVRWTVISQAVDDRTSKERGLEDLEKPDLERKASLADYERPPPHQYNTEDVSTAASSRAPQRLHKSRYDSISTYLSLESDFNPLYNDVPCEQDKPSYDTLIAAGIDPLLAKHISHLFVRDPLVIYDESVIQDDATSSDHFENLQSTNWQTVRFKPPPPVSTVQLGWRVEFRTMEVQLTDMENAAYTVFVALISRAILFLNLNFYIPISKVDDNLKRAHKRDAVNTEQFYWRKVVNPCQPTPSSPLSSDSATPSSAPSSSAAGCAGFSSPTSSASTSAESIANEYEEMSMAEIMTGKASCGFPGLIPLVRTYLDMIQCDATTLQTVDSYLQLLELRATGQLLTAASWLRKYVSIHPAYQHDSQLTQPVVVDMMRAVVQIQSGQCEVVQLLGKLKAQGGLGSEEAEATDGAKVELKGAPRLLDLDDAQCCEKFRAYLSRHQTVHMDGSK